MGKDKLSRKKFLENTKMMLMIGSLLLFSGGTIYGAIIYEAIIVNNRISVLTFASMIVGIIIGIAGVFLVARSSYIEKLNATGKPTSIKSIKIGERYKVISAATSNKPEPDDKRKVYLLLQKENTEDVFFYQRKKGEEPKLSVETGDTIISIKGEFIIRKE